MASATATATMAAAAGFDKRSSAASSLYTPGSGTFPSELLSPMINSPSVLRKDDLRTPITPPSAYLDFLKNMSPAMLSPAPSSTSARFSFTDEKSDKLSEPLSAKPLASPPTSQPHSQPPFSRNSSYDSNASINSIASNQSAASHNTSHSSSSGSSRKRPESPRVIIPPSPFAKPAIRSARTPRLHIPQSPLNPALNSAQSIPSPYSATPLSAAPWSASFSPREADPADINGKPGKVSVRQVVTRTVTYCRTPLDPAPRGKRRKVEIEELDSKSSSEEPPVKQEKLDDDDDSTPCATEPSKDL